MLFPSSLRTADGAVLRLVIAALLAPALAPHRAARVPVERSAATTSDVVAPVAREELAFERATLAALRADPLPWIGRRVSFRLQVDAPSASWIPYFSRFGPADWTALSAWPDEAFTWEPAVYADPAPHLFVRRGTAAAELAQRAERSQRFEAVGVVREIFLGEPWIELEVLRPLPGAVNEGTILHVERALAFLAEGSCTLAEGQLQRALDAPLPDHAVREIERLRAEVERVRLAQEADKKR